MCHESRYGEQPPSILQAVTRPDRRRIHPGPEALGIGPQRHYAHVNFTVTKTQLSQHDEAELARPLTDGHYDAGRTNERSRRASLQSRVAQAILKQQKVGA